MPTTRNRQLAVRQPKVLPTGEPKADRQLKNPLKEIKMIRCKRIGKQIRRRCCLAVRQILSRKM